MNPKGTLLLLANGRYAMIIVDPDRPRKWTGKSRESTTVEELASAARGLVAQFAEWSVDEAGQILIRKNEGGLNPLAAGREQRVQLLCQEMSSKPPMLPRVSQAVAQRRRGEG